jgi:hypothetical protein
VFLGNTDISYIFILFDNSFNSNGVTAWIGENEMLHEWQYNIWNNMKNNVGNYAFVGEMDKANFTHNICNQKLWTCSNC